jgi:F-box-like
MSLLESLPVEILLEIFEYCKVQPLMRVCTTFKELIVNSPQLMRKVNLIISEKSPLSLLTKMERNIQSVYFKFHYKIDESCLKLFEAFNEVKSIEFVRCIVSVNVFMQILKSLPHLESLSVYATHLRGKDEMCEDSWSNLDVPVLKRLKNLNFRNSDIGFLRFLQGAKIKTLSALLPAQYSPDDLATFLQTQSSIRTIESLSVSKVDGSLLTILLKDSNHLKRLHIECDRIDMTSVRELELSNTSIEYLNLCGFPETEGDFSADFIRVSNFFKGLKTFEIEMNNHLEPDLVAQLHPVFSKLECLIITHCSGDYFNSIALPKLKCLQLTDGTQSARDWTHFSQRNPSIQSIIIKDESITSSVFRTICTEFRNLKHFEVNYDPQRLTPEILDFICDEHFPQNIKSLKVTQRVSSQERFLTLTHNQLRALDKNPGFNCVFN